MNDEKCPGDGRCHGPMQWCSWCGDVDLVCDFPECDCHPRIRQVTEEMHSANKAVWRLKQDLLYAERRLQEAQEKLKRYMNGPYRMTDGTRLDAVRDIMDS